MAIWLIFLKYSSDYVFPLPVSSLTLTLKSVCCFRYLYMEKTFHGTLLFDYQAPAHRFSFPKSPLLSSPNQHQAILRHKLEVQEFINSDTVCTNFRHQL